MKKVLATIIMGLVAIALPLSTKAEMRWAATAGATVSNMVFKQDIVPVSKVIGYTAGITGEAIFPGIGIGVDIGLLYDQQGALVNLGQREIWSSLGYGNEHVHIHTIKIPIHLRWKYTRLNGVEDKIAPLIYAGPEFNIQVGHGKCDAFKYSGGDLGIAVGLGAELWKKWQVTAGYVWGLTYVMKTRLLDNYSARSRQWTLKVAYFF